MKIKELSENNLLWNILSCGLTTTHDSEELRKIIFLNTTLILGAFFQGTFGMLSIFQGYPYHAIIDYIFLALILFYYIYLRNTLNYNVISMAGTVTLGGYFSFLFISGGVGNTGYLWAYTYPLIAIFLLGNPKGTFFSLAMLAVQIIAFFFKDNIPFYPNYEEVLVFRFIPTYLLVFALAFIHEQIRTTTYNKLKDTNNRLQEAVDDLQTAQEKLKELAIKDGLTGLFNRRHFDEIINLSLHHAKRYGGELSLLMIDIDYFKIYNDYYGHLEGDEVLKQFGAMLQASIEKETDTACRYGGEEFSIILNNASPAEAAETAKKIIINTEKLGIHHEGSPLKKLTTSIGIATVPPEKEITPQKLIEQADQALYQAKESGRNRFERLQF